MRAHAHGISGFFDPKFWLTLFCYAATLPLFMQGGLTWDNFHLFMPACISFIVVTTLAWDYRIVGNPKDLHCLALHFAFFVSLIFLLNRLMTLADFAPLTANPAAIQGIVMGWMPSMPFLGGIFAIFDFALKWLGFALILFMVSGAIMFPPRTATALLFIFGVLVVLLSVGRNFNASAWPLFLGMGLQFAAFLLQRVDQRKSRFWNQVAERLSRSGSRSGMDMKIKIAILRELNAQHSLGANQIRGLVAGQLDQPSNTPALVPVCDRITDQLVNHDHLAESRDGLHGWRCVLALPEDEPDFFTTCARTVRVLLTLGFCVIYILSPIDFIPDATPVFGVVDDLVLGTVGLLSSLRTVYGPARPSDWPGRKLPFGE